MTRSALTGPETLKVRDLRVATPATELIHGVSFEVRKGERVGLIGESGSGKSLTAVSIMGLLPDGLEASGSIELAGTSGNLLEYSDRDLSRLRGQDIATVFQEPMTALNPLMRVGDQVAEALLQHRTAPTAQAAQSRARELIEMVKLPNPSELVAAFPHQLSGGQRQRVMIAIAMANSPRLLICDEPTTALDVTVQAEVLRLIGELVERTGTSLLFITHDIGVIAEVCDRVMVMYRGEIVESASVREILTAPQHPYTKALIAASDLTSVDDNGRLRTVADSLGTATRLPDAAMPAERTDAIRISQSVAHQRRVGDETVIFNESKTEPLIRVRGVTREYRGRRTSLLSRPEPVHGLREVDFDVAAGQRFGIVGESGSGKSTLLRMLCALDTPTSGSIRVAGQEIVGAKERDLREFRSRVQIIFQDPMGSLDPRMRVGDIVAEPLRGVPRSEARERVAEMLESVGLEADVVDRHPHQFSGGQRQRISIARALITRPEVLIADEAVSALDVSVRAQVLNLLADLVDEYSLTLLFVSHDLGVIRHACDTVAVLSNGLIVEAGPTAAVYDSPQHPYTQQLIRATPSLAALAETGN